MPAKSITLLGNQVPQVSIKSQKSAKHQSIEDEQPSVVIPSLNEILAASESSPEYLLPSITLPSSTSGNVDTPSPTAKSTEAHRPAHEVLLTTQSLTMQHASFHDFSLEAPLQADE